MFIGKGQHEFRRAALERCPRFGVIGALKAQDLPIERNGLRNIGNVEDWNRAGEHHGRSGLNGQVGKATGRDDGRNGEEGVVA
jgi:hypothetical protein